MSIQSQIHITALDSLSEEHQKRPFGALLEMGPDNTNDHGGPDVKTLRITTTTGTDLIMVDDGIGMSVDNIQNLTDQGQTFQSKKDKPGNHGMGGFQSWIGKKALGRTVLINSVHTK